jgi:dinuclear metal center YbgI/SA1388 family protein
MTTTRDVLEVLDDLAPQRYAFDFDRVGLQVGDSDAEIRSAVVSLDRSNAAIEASLQTDLLLTHHPLLDRPAETVTTRTYEGRAIRKLLQHNVQFIAAHTNWDSARGGVNDALAARLGLTEVEDFGTAALVPRACARYEVEAEEAKLLLHSLAQLGVPSDAATILVSEKGHRVEVTIRRDQIKVQNALPYNFAIGPLDDHPEQPAGRVGTCTPMALKNVAAYVERYLHTRTETWGDPERIVRRIAVVGGSAGSEWRHAQAAGADLFLSGEIRQNVALEASDSGLAIMSGGHYATEQPGVVALAQALAERLPQIEWHVFEPTPGFAGRPNHTTQSS